MLSAIASSITQSRGQTARTSAPSADIRGRATTTLRMHLPPLRYGVGSVAHPKERFQRYGVFLHCHHLQTVPSDTFLLRQFPIQGRTGQSAEYSIFEVVQRWIAPNGRTTTVARLRGMSLFYYDNTVTWRCARNKKIGHTTSLRDAPIPDSVSYPK